MMKLILGYIIKIFIMSCAIVSMIVLLFSGILPNTLHFMVSEASSVEKVSMLVFILSGALLAGTPKNQESNKEENDIALGDKDNAESVSKHTKLINLVNEGIYTGLVILVSSTVGYLYAISLDSNNRLLNVCRAFAIIGQITLIIFISMKYKISRHIKNKD